jgi:hypothetical protein
VDVVDDEDGFATARGAGSVVSKARGVGGGVIDVEGAREVEGVVEKRAVVGQTGRTIQILEDMLRACALKYGKSWDKSLPYAEFSYNNSYQASIKMAPYEALYGQQCRTPLFWSQTGESQVFGPKVLKDAERQVQMVHESLKVAQSR